MSISPGKMADILELVDALRARGARLIEVHPDGSIKVVFDGPAPKTETDKDVAAEVEAKRRADARGKRSLDDRLLRPLGIKKDDAA